MTLPRSPSAKAVFTGPFFWLFTTRLILACILTTIGGVAFAYEHISLGIIFELCAAALVGTVVVKMFSAIGVVNLPPEAQHVRNMGTVVEHTSNLAMVVDSHFRITWVNAAFTRITGYTPEEAIGKTAAQLLDPSKDDPSVAEHALRQIPRDEKPIRMTILNRKKNGDLFWSDSELQPILDAHQALTGYVEISVDVTEQKAMLARLQEQANELQRLANVARFTSNGVVILDTEGKVAWFNSAAPAVMGIPPEALAHFNWDDVQRNFHVRHFEHIQAAIATEAQGTVQAARMELELADDNRGRWLETELQPLFSDDMGNTIFEGWMLVMLDITARRRSADELRTSEARLRAIYQVLPVGVTISDNEGLIIDCNQKAEELLEIRRQDYLGHRIDNTLAWLVTDEMGNPLNGETLPSGIALRQKVRVDNRILHFRTNTKQIWLSVSAAPIEDEALGVAIAYFDISHQQEQFQAMQIARQQAEVVSQSKSYFLANMSQEIRTPMNAVTNLLNLLRETELSRKQRDYVDQTTMATKSLLALLGDILDFSKVEAGKMVLNPQPTSMPSFWSDLGSLLRNSVERRDVELIFRIDPNVPVSLILDSLRFQQVLLNLLSNALKFTVTGWVELWVHWDNERLHVTVQDTGVGISEENQRGLFEGFVQIEANAERRVGGTGLGLAITKRLVRMMGSDLIMHSVPGEGSTFSFVMECVCVEPPTSWMELSSCLVVSSHERIRTTLVTLVSFLHAKVDVDASPMDALRRLQNADQSTYHTLYLDVHNEDFSAWQLVQALDSLEGMSWANIVFFVHPLDHEHHFHQILDQGRLGRTVLPRPVTYDNLLVALWEKGSHTHGAAPTNKPLHGLNIMVVEDNPINQQVAKEMLLKKGARVVLASHGQHAIDLLSASSSDGILPDLILMDIQMPNMDGYAATKAIRSLPLAAHLPILSVTASAVIQDEDAELTRGFDGHITKPFDMGEVVEVILHHVRLKPTLDKTEREAIVFTPSNELTTTMYPLLSEKAMSEQLRARSLLRDAILECILQSVHKKDLAKGPVQLSNDLMFEPLIAHCLSVKFEHLACDYPLFLGLLHAELKAASPMPFGVNKWLLCEDGKSLFLQENEPPNAIE